MTGAKYLSLIKNLYLLCIWENFGENGKSSFQQDAAPVYNHLDERAYHTDGFKQVGWA